jgi:hypothetical protein
VLLLAAAGALGGLQLDDAATPDAQGCALLSALAFLPAYAHVSRLAS